MERKILRGLLYAVLAFALAVFLFPGAHDAGETQFRALLFVVGAVAALAVSAPNQPEAPATSARPAAGAARPATAAARRAD